MPSIEKISIALPAEMVSLVREAVETGEYASSSEVVRDALRDWKQKRQLQKEGLSTLRALWKEARSDKSTPLDPDKVFDALELKYQALAATASDLK